MTENEVKSSLELHERYYAVAQIETSDRESDFVLLIVSSSLSSRCSHPLRIEPFSLPTCLG